MSQARSSSSSRERRVCLPRSDHYAGLTERWSPGPIYCSEVTARVVRERVGVAEEWLRPLPMREAVVVDGGEPSARFGAHARSRWL